MGEILERKNKDGKMLNQLHLVSRFPLFTRIEHQTVNVMGFSISSKVYLILLDFGLIYLLGHLLVLPVIL